jgi:hypothetical protein
MMSTMHRAEVVAQQEEIMAEEAEAMAEEEAEAGPIMLMAIIQMKTMMIVIIMDLTEAGVRQEVGPVGREDQTLQPEEEDPIITVVERHLYLIKTLLQFLYVIMEKTWFYELLEKTLQTKEENSTLVQIMMTVMHSIG